VPLVDPLAPDANSQTAQLAELFNVTLGFVPNSVLTMQRRPAIAAAFTALNRAVMTNHGRITDEQKRLVALLSSQAAGCRYCQAHATLAATRYGATEARLAALWDFRSSPLFSDAERAAFEFALAASQVPNEVTPSLMAQLKQHWDDGEIVELTAVVALFGYLNRWNDAMATTLEAPASRIAEQHLGPIQWHAGKHGTPP
jgi:uncharacterized peroxidase-related enzyme